VGFLEEQSLLLWARRNDLIPCVNAAFEVQTWADIGAKLWEEISMESKEASKFSTLWRLIHETLKAMRAERGVAASAFAALTPQGGSCSATSLLFQGLSIPVPPVKAGGGQSRRPVEAGEPAVQEKEHAWSDLLAQEFPSPPPESLPPPPRRGEGCAEVPPPADWPGTSAAPSDCPMSPNPVPWYPPLPPPTPPSPGTPVTRCTDKKVTDILLPKPLVPNPYNPFSLPAPPCAVPWDGGVGNRGRVGGTVERDSYSDGSCRWGSSATIGRKTEKGKKRTRVVLIAEKGITFGRNVESKDRLAGGKKVVREL